MNIKSDYVYPPIHDQKFPIYIGKQQYTNQDEIFRLHWHEHFELIFMQHGELFLTCNNKTFHARKGDLLVINPNDIHHFRSITTYVDYYCIIFDLSLLRSLTTDPLDIEFLIPLANNQLFFDNLISYNDEMSDCLKHLVDEYNNKRPSCMLAIKAYLFLMLTLLFRNCNYSVLTHSTLKRKNHNIFLIKNILDYLHTNYMEDIDIESLAKSFNISYHHLCHLFKDYTNKTIIQYVTSLRIDKATYYLINTDKSITEIALLVGYHDANYFSRMFKKAKSISPRDFLRTLM